MDQEMDFRNFLLTVAHHWRLVAIIVLIAVIAGVLVAFLWPPEYRATATVAITKPRYVLDFDDQLRSLSSTTGSSLPLGVIATNAYTQLAMNDELKQLVLKDLGWGISLSELEEMIKIRADSGVIQFTGKDSSPERASQIANAWARLYSAQLNALFSSTVPNTTALEGASVSATSTLLQSEQALADFQARSQITSLEKQLEAASTALSDRLALTDRLSMLAADARVLQGRLRSQEATAPTAASQFQTLIMEAQAVSPRLEAPLQLQFNVDSSALSSMSATELDQYLEAFAKGLEQRRQEADQEAQTLPAEMSVIQMQLEKQNNEYDRLLLARAVARDTSESIARKLDEERLRAALDESEVKVVGQAAVPTEPASPKPIVVLVAALLAGVVVGLLAALLAETIRQS